MRQPDHTAWRDACPAAEADCAQLCRQVADLTRLDSHRVVVAVVCAAQYLSLGTAIGTLACWSVCCASPARVKQVCIALAVVDAVNKLAKKICRLSIQLQHLVMQDSC